MKDDNPKGAACRWRPRLEPLFVLGKIVATPGALDAFSLTNERASWFIRRHACGDWGDLDKDDKRRNDRALKDGAQLLSAYRLKTGVRFYIITEADRSATTLLLPDEY